MCSAQPESVFSAMACCLLPSPFSGPWPPLVRPRFLYILPVLLIYSNSEIILSLGWEERLWTDRVGDLNSPLGVLLVLFTIAAD